MLGDGTGSHAACCANSLTSCPMPLSLQGRTQSLWVGCHKPHRLGTPQGACIIWTWAQYSLWGSSPPPPGLAPIVALSCL